MSLQVLIWVRDRRRKICLSVDLFIGLFLGWQIYNVAKLFIGGGR